MSEQHAVEQGLLYDVDHRRALMDVLLPPLRAGCLRA
jgi:hypothetical protein